MQIDIVRLCVVESWCWPETEIWMTRRQKAFSASMYLHVRLEFGPSALKQNTFRRSFRNIWSRCSAATIHISYLLDLQSYCAILHTHLPPCRATKGRLQNLSTLQPSLSWKDKNQTATWNPMLSLCDLVKMARSYKLYVQELLCIECLLIIECRFPEPVGSQLQSWN